MLAHNSFWMEYIISYYDLLCFVELGVQLCVHYDFSVNDPTINTEGNNSNSNHLLPPLLKLATSPTMTPTFEKHFYLSSNNLHVVLEMVAILGIILEYFIKQFQGILNLVINSCNVWP